MKHAYLDKYGILHISEVRGEGVETDFDCDGGFPVIEGKKVYMYSLEEVYIGGNRNSFEAGAAKELDLSMFPALKELYIACK